MPTVRERWAGAFVQAAPLLGLPFWALRIWMIDAGDHADYDSTGTFFSSGLFMLGAGLLAALAVRFTSKSTPVRQLAGAAMRFQLWALAISIVLVLLCAIPFVLGSGAAATTDQPPPGLFAAVFVTGLSFGIVLPLLELGRALILSIRALNP